MSHYPYHLASRLGFSIGVSQMSVARIQAELATLEKLHLEASSDIVKAAIASRIADFCILLSVAKLLQSYPSKQAA